MKATDAYPLTWPAGWRRIQESQRAAASFGRQEAVYRDDRGADGISRRVHAYNTKKRLSVADAIDRVLLALDRMGCSRDLVVVSTNVPVRLDGLPRSGAAEPKDPGAAVYWRVDYGRATRCMAIDRYTRVADNLAAIAGTLEAMRSIERYGGASILDRAFTGFQALAAPEQDWQVLELEGPPRSRADVMEAYRRLASKHHPDKGGDAATMARINSARDRLLEELA